MAEPTGFISGLYVSANVFLGKLIHTLSIWFILAAVGILLFIAYWYIHRRRR